MDRAGRKGGLRHTWGGREVGEVRVDRASREACVAYGVAERWER